MVFAYPMYVYTTTGNSSHTVYQYSPRQHTRKTWSSLGKIHSKPLSNYQKPTAINNRFTWTIPIHPALLTSSKILSHFLPVQNSSQKIHEKYFSLMRNNEDNVINSVIKTTLINTRYSTEPFNSFQWIIYVIQCN